MTQQRISFYFDILSPASYLAWTQLPNLVDPHLIDYRPIFLAGVFKGSQNIPPILNPSKARYMRQDFLRCAQHYNVPMHFNRSFPFNSLVPMRILAALTSDSELFHRVLHVLFESTWVNDHKVDELQALNAALSDAGLDADALIALGHDENSKRLLQQETEAAVERGVFGAPTFFVGDEMFFGQDRLDFVVQAIQKNH